MPHSEAAHRWWRAFSHLVAPTSHSVFVLAAGAHATVIKAYSRFSFCPRIFFAVFGTGTCKTAVRSSRRIECCIRGDSEGAQRRQGTHFSEGRCPCDETAWARPCSRRRRRNPCPSRSHPQRKSSRASSRRAAPAKYRDRIRARVPHPSRRR